MSAEPFAWMGKRLSARAGMFFLSSLAAFDTDVVAPAERAAVFGAEASKLGPVVFSSLRTGDDSFGDASGS